MYLVQSTINSLLFDLISFLRGPVIHPLKNIVEKHRSPNINNAIWDGGSTAPAKLLIPHRTQNCLETQER